MKSTVILFLLMFMIIPVYAQDESENASDTTEGWKVKGTFGIGFSQVSLTNWVAGGENSVSGNISLRVGADYKMGKHSWTNFLLTSYGLQKLGKSDFQKNEDIIELNSKYGYQIGKKWHYAVNMNLRTQLSPGYRTPEDSIKGSDFFAPAYIVLSTGFDYKPNDNFSILLAPVAGKFTIVADDFLSSIGAYGVDPGSTSRSEFGGFIQLIYTKENLIKNVNFINNLNLFSNYFENPEKIDVNWQMIFDLKVNKFLTASLTTHLIYDYDIKFAEMVDGQEVLTDKVQFMEAFSLGLTVSF